MRSRFPLSTLLILFFRKGSRITHASGQPTCYQRHQSRLLHLWASSQRSIVPRYICMVHGEAPFMAAERGSRQLVFAAVGN